MVVIYNEDLDMIIQGFTAVKTSHTELSYKYFINKNGVILNANRRTLTIMKPKIGDNGYASVGIRNENGERKFYTVHRLVAQTFIPNYHTNAQIQVNHKDGNKLNNNVDNLEWCTQTENTQHAYDTGLIKNVKKKFNLFKNDIFVDEFDAKKDLVNYLVNITGLSFDNIRKVISGSLKTQNKILQEYTYKQIE